MTDNYSNKILERMSSPLHSGEISKDFVQENNLKLVIADYDSNNTDAIRVYWAIDKQTHIIKYAKFQSFSTGVITALNDMLIELCINKSVEQASKITKTDVEFALRDFANIPAMQIQELYDKTLHFVVIKKAALLYENVDMNDFSDDYIVCECSRVTLGTIKDAIRKFELTTIEDISNITKAGIFCKSCVRKGGLEEKEIYLEDILKQTLDEIQKEKDEKNIDTNSPFINLSKEEKLKIIEKVLDEDIRPMLIMDGGNMEILDLMEAEVYSDLYIRYLGACNGCSAGSMGTLYAIESILQNKVYENLRVLPV